MLFNQKVNGDIMAIPEKLIEKGYVFRVNKKGVQEFQITEPTQLKTRLLQQENVIDDLISSIQTYQHKKKQQ